MNHSKKSIVLCLLFISFFLVSYASAQRQMESLDRGVVAVNQGNGNIFVSWRMLGCDQEEIGFNLYRTIDGKTVRVNKKPIFDRTCFQDKDVHWSRSLSYFVKPIINGEEQDASKPYTFVADAPARPYLSIPLQTPEGTTPNDASVGDLDGDGSYEIVLHQASRGRDNAHKGITGPAILQAYKLDGTLLWTINLGKNIREGAHYTQFIVYDLDGDGKAEIACKTADGTRDGVGNIIGDVSADYRNEDGYILAGPEYLTVFDGLTGKAMVTTNYIPPRHPDTLYPTSQQIKDVWGDGYGNRVDRFFSVRRLLGWQAAQLSHVPWILHENGVSGLELARWKTDSSMDV